MKKRIGMVTSIIIFIFVIAGCSNNNDNEETLEKIDAESFGEVFLQGDFKRIYAQMSDAFQADISEEELRDLGEEFNEEVEAYILASTLPMTKAMTQYVWTDEAETKGMVVIMDDEVINGLRIMPLTTYPDTDDTYTETTFELPFEEEWLVFWGGTNSLINYHYEYDNQRYAYDFIQMKDHQSFVGDPTKNEDYLAFGQKYLAPADGTIVAVENDIADNEPVGQMNEEQPLGNHVIIDHGNDEYSYLAHFKEGTIEVAEGDKVKSGDTLGQVGNSGNSSEPHIHFHVADAIDLEESNSIRIQLESGDFQQGEIAVNE